MAFEKVNIKLARESLTAMKNSLTTDIEKDILESISMETNFKSMASESLKKGIKQLTQTRYQDLITLIDSYLKIIDQMEDYKELENRVQEVEDDIKDEKKEDDPSSSLLRKLRNKKSDYESQMKQIELNVDSLI